MLKAARKHMRSAALLGVAAALAVGGVAVAQGNSQSGSQGARDQGSRPPGPPPGGMPIKGLTYAELHVQTKDGEAKVIRLDQGKVAAVDSDSITVAENDGSDVTIAVDEDTKVIGKPGAETALTDLASGQQVTVSGPEGGTAESIMVAPKKGEVKGGPQGAPMPPPLGAPQDPGE